MAVVGASATPGRVGYSFVQNLKRYGFPGAIYPINPNLKEVQGLTVYPSVLALPQRVDLAVVAVSPALVPGIIGECGQKGIPAALVLSAGFAETGGEGQRLQAEMIRTARQWGVRLMGPNTQGVINWQDRVALVGVTIPKGLDQPGPVSFICQSALFAWEFAVNAPETGINKMIDLGNMADVDHAQALEYLGDDPATRVIVLEMESLGDGRRLREVAGRVARRKPVLALKVGRTASGGRAVASHTGSLSGPYQLYQAFLRQTGVLPLEDMDDLLDATRALAYLPPVRGPRVGVLTTTGAGGAMAADACEDYGLELARLSPESVARVQATLPPGVPIHNPADVCQVLDPERLLPSISAGLEALDQDPGVDAIAIIGHLLPQTMFHILPALQQWVLKPDRKPAVMWAISEEGQRQHLPPLAQKGLLYCPTIRRALKSLALAYSFYRRQRDG